MAKQLESLEDILIQTLLEMEIITPGFTGEITLKISQGGLRDVDRLEKSLKRSGKWCKD
jgi:hypothetical protein